MAEDGFAISDVSVKAQAQAIAPDGLRTALLYLRGGEARLALIALNNASASNEIALGLGRCSGLAWSPDGRWLAFTGPSNTMPMGQDVCILEIATGEWRSVTSKLGLHAHLPSWAPDSDRVTFAAYEPPSRADYPPHIFVVRVSTGQIEQLTDSAQADFTPQFAPDGQALAFRRNGEAWLFDLATHTTRCLTQLGAVQLNRGCFSPDGTQLVCEYGPSNQRQIAVVDLMVGTLAVWDWPDHDLRSPCWSADGKHIAVVEDRRHVCFGTPAGSPQGYATDGDGAIRTDFYAAPQWVADTDAVAVLDNDGNSWLLSNTAVSRKLTNFIAQTPSDYVPEEIAYPGDDGCTIPALLFRPTRAVSGPPRAVVWVHGGPRAQEDHRNPYIHALVTVGYTVLVPDYRGSSGHGAAWEVLTPEEAGIVDVGDVIAGGCFLCTAGLATSAQLGVAGYSYGGYLTLLALAAAPELWTAGASLWGILDVGRSPWLRATARERAQQWLDARSPLARSARIVAPLLILHGAHDTTSTVEEVEHVARQLNARGIRCAVQIFGDDTHGLSRHTAECCVQLVAFFQQQIGDGDTD